MPSLDLQSRKRTRSRRTNKAQDPPPQPRLRRAETIEIMLETEPHVARESVSSTPKPSPIYEEIRLPDVPTMDQLPSNGLEASTMSSQAPEEPLPTEVASQVYEEIANQPTPVLERNLMIAEPTTPKIIVTETPQKSTVEDPMIYQLWHRKVERSVTKAQDPMIYGLWHREINRSPSKTRDPMIFNLWNRPSYGKVSMDTSAIQDPMIYQLWHRKVSQRITKESARTQDPMIHDLWHRKLSTQSKQATTAQDPMIYNLWHRESSVESTKTTKAQDPMIYNLWHREVPVKHDPMIYNLWHREVSAKRDPMIYDLWHREVSAKRDPMIYSLWHREVPVKHDPMIYNLWHREVAAKHDPMIYQLWHRESQGNVRPQSSLTRDPMIYKLWHRGPSGKVVHKTPMTQDPMIFQLWHREVLGQISSQSPMAQDPMIYQLWHRVVVSDETKETRRPDYLPPFSPMPPSDVGESSPSRDGQNFMQELTKARAIRQSVLGRWTTSGASSEIEFTTSPAESSSAQECEATEKENTVGQQGNSSNITVQPHLFGFPMPPSRSASSSDLSEPQSALTSEDAAEDLETPNSSVEGDASAYIKPNYDGSGYGGHDEDRSRRRVSFREEPHLVEEIIEHQVEDYRDESEAAELSPDPTPRGLDQPLPEEETSELYYLKNTVYREEPVKSTPAAAPKEDDNLEALNFAPRDVTNIPWKSRERGDSVTPSLLSQSTTSSGRSSPIEMPEPAQLQDPMVQHLWHRQVGDTARIRNDSVTSNSNPYEDSFGNWERTKPLPHQPKPEPAADMRRASGTGTLFQRMRNVFENKGAEEEAAASPARARPSSLFNPIARARSSIDTKGVYSYLNGHEGDSEERSSLMRAPTDGFGLH